MMDRRQFLVSTVTAGAGLTLAVHAPALAGSPGGFAPNAFVRVDADGLVTVVVKHLEMGQGVATGLPALVAEELEVPWAAVRVEYAPVDTATYKNLAMGMQGTGGSTAIRNSWEQLRKAGAAAREMLLEAGAAHLGVPRSQVAAEQGKVVHAGSGRHVAYGRLVEAAARLAPPENPPLKSPDQFKIIGKVAAKRTDTKAKSDGSARYGIDMRQPYLLTAVVLRAPAFGARLKRMDAARAQALPGVKAVFPIPSGVAVVAEDFWTAAKARELVKAEWTPAPDASLSTAAMRERFTRLLAQPGQPAAKAGDAEAALAAAPKRIQAVYEAPYLAHAPMEPINAVAKVDGGAVEIWTGCQFHTVDQANAARAAGVKPEQVTIHTLLAGGSFGRRANAGSDFIVEAVEVAKRLPGTPVKLMWTREDDIAGGLYRPFFVHGFDAAVDAAGMPVAWRHRLAGQSIAAGTPFESMMVKDGVDHLSVEGAANLPYAIPNLEVELHSPHLPVPVLWWRSVGSSHNAFVTECFLDELAAAGGKDPLELRRALLAGKPRHLAVLELAAAKAGWGTPLPPGRGRGIAVHESFHSFVAEVAEVAVDAKGNVKVERVVCAVDCGVAVTPDQVRAQMEGGIAYGLSAALAGEITLKAGAAEQSNFHDYVCLRMDQMPQVEVHIVDSDAPPSGVGEPGVPPIAPAVVNAIFAATGKRIRRLPIGDQLKQA